LLQHCIGSCDRGVGVEHTARQRSAGDVRSGSNELTGAVLLSSHSRRNTGTDSPLCKPCGART
jgi:hypothetical protein